MILMMGRGKTDDLKLLSNAYYLLSYYENDLSSRIEHQRLINHPREYMLFRKMKLLFFLAHLILVFSLMTTQASFALDLQNNDTKMYCDDGLLISNHVCLPVQYDKTEAPDKNMWIITDFDFVNFREVDDRKMTITFDILISYFWRDDRINREFPEGVHPINGKNKDTIWRPEVYIEHVKKFEQRDWRNRMRLDQLQVFNDKEISPWLFGYEFNDNHSFVSDRKEVQVSLYCNFLFSDYPMDTQVCTFKLGSPGIDDHHTVGFKLAFNGTDCLKNRDKGLATNALQDFEVKTKCYPDVGSDRTLRRLVTEEMDWVAFNITLTRILRPIFLKYYLPCIAIVASSQISFFIPITAIPARTALLATLFLALINIFMSQQVL